MDTNSGFGRRLRNGCSRMLERTLGKATLTPEQVNTDEVRRIIVVTSHGDLQHLLLAMPAIRAVRKKYPHAHVAVLTKHDFAPFLEKSSNVDESISMYERGDWSVRKAISFAKHLRSGFDLAIVLNTASHSLASDVPAFLTGAKYILGPDHPVLPGCTKNFIYNLIAPPIESSKHESERMLDVVRYIQADADSSTVEMSLTTQDKNHAIEFLTFNDVLPEEKIVALHISPTTGPDHWPAEKYLRTARHFGEEEGTRIVVSWEPQQATVGEQLMEDLPFKAIAAAGLSLNQLSAVFNFSHVLICSDLGMMHLAASVGIPTVGLFAESDAERWKPVGEQFAALTSEDGSIRSIREQDVIAVAERMVREYPKTLSLDVEDFDISDQVLEGYMELLDEFDD